MMNYLEAEPREILTTKTRKPVTKNLIQEHYSQKNTAKINCRPHYTIVPILEEFEDMLNETFFLDLE